MRIHVYEPLLKAVQTDDDQVHKVPDHVLTSASKGREIDKVRRWARDSGLVHRRDHIAFFTAA